jgi:A/G-specific adenine glycosylase
VSRASEYFRRWVARWPTVAHLASASQEEVNEAWAGLGYYRRARFLLEGARHVVDQLGGALPADPEELRKIPGERAQQVGGTPGRRAGPRQRA